ncbi:TetR/AcrR family transcriptional regulator [Eubacterium aggregans]|uniref:TetR/AcrR family transcriptional regulator n=1 Tax=Eubacterium aggregans TaxID=81409 RepID=UPI003F37F8A4
MNKKKENCWCEELSIAEKKEDRRVRKTKHQLRQALTELLKEKPIQEIKVREIADLIDINRGNFYQHYRDIYDMLYQIEDELFAQFNQILAETEEEADETIAMPLLTKIFTFLKDNSDLTVALMGPNGDPVFVEKVKALVKERCIHDWMHAYHDAKTPNFEYYYAFVVSGCLGIFQR